MASCSPSPLSRLRPANECNRSTTRPSPSDRRAELSSLKNTLRGDLDWIVLKAMAKDRELRYESAGALEADLKRYLSNEPILSRPASAAYRLRKFARRNRTGLALTGTAALGLAVLVVNQSIQSARVRAARDVADARRTQAEGLIDFMLSDLREKLEPIGRLDVLGDVGDQATAYFATLDEDEFSDEELLSRSQALYQIGEVHFEQGRPAEASQSFAESLRLVQALSVRDPTDPARLFGLSQSHFWVGYAAWGAGDLAVAEEQFRGYLEAARRMVAIDSLNAEYRLELAYAHGNLGSVSEARGDLPAALNAFTENLEVKRRLAQSAPTNVSWLGELAESHKQASECTPKAGAIRRGAAGTRAGARDQVARARTRTLARLLALSHGRRLRVPRLRAKTHRSARRSPGPYRPGDRHARRTPRRRPDKPTNATGAWEGRAGPMPESWRGSVGGATR